MGRAPCCDKANVKRGPWSPEEDATLKSYVEKNGTGGNWISLPQRAGLRRCGKSCRLRWLNYLRPDIKHGGFTDEEDGIICSLFKSLGSRWSVIASQLPGRTDNDVKNYWNTKLKKRFFSAQPAAVKPTKPAPPPPPPAASVLTIKTDPFQFSTQMDPTFLLPSLPYPDFSAFPTSFMSPTAEDLSAASSSMTTDNSTGGLWMENDGLMMDMRLDASADVLDWSLQNWVGGFENQSFIFPGTPWAAEACNSQDLHKNMSYS